eukprot:CAMPEP_0184374682 /NCGR_PEP_ID=MMETSP1089-20130417/165156_1 /TAXON_ID=38269 ORGANISM="Gloeochaete wittrockiana, Strain SAG46.84" /NCGR_SAMPLE_ID=MMETSP1089 /ASSEMBLY_ACC=CAM_ASM_000445 /LENGTH=89 /DNA_ID=CAMNT_0026717705 /DNA_START=716 /DNA_END=985 /DNA_ORIENTATION=-
MAWPSLAPGPSPNAVVFIELLLLLRDDWSPLETMGLRRRGCDQVRISVLNTCTSASGCMSSVKPPYMTTAAWGRKDSEPNPVRLKNPAA